MCYLLITNLEMTAFAAEGITDADNSGIVAEETITDTNMLSPDAEDQTGKEAFQQEEGSLTEDDPAEESTGASEEDEMSEPTEHPSDEFSKASDDTLTGDLTESIVGGTDGSSRSETANDGKNDINETVEITAWDELQEAFCTDCSIMLMQDITADSGGDPLTVPSGVTITLNLNGHTLDLKPGYQYIVINGSLTLIGEGDFAVANNSI